MLNFENMSRPEMIAARRTIRDNLDTLAGPHRKATPPHCPAGANQKKGDQNHEH